MGMTESCCTFLLTLMLHSMDSVGAGSSVFNFCRFSLLHKDLTVFLDYYEDRCHNKSAAVFIATVSV